MCMLSCRRASTGSLVPHDLVVYSALPGADDVDLIPLSCLLAAPLYIDALVPQVVGGNKMGWMIIRL